VFTRKGQPIVSMHKAFRAACKAAGVGDRMLHDLRRSAIRRMVRKGISETVPMRLSGHKTMSVFRRYDITSTDELRDAAQRLETRATCAGLGDALELRARVFLSAKRDFELLRDGRRDGRRCIG